MHEIGVDEVFTVEKLEITAFPTTHDTAQSVGYRISGSSVFAIATDTGCITPELREGLRGANCVLIESNHDLEMLKNGTYPVYLKRRILADTGHLSNDDCAYLARSLARDGTENIILGHLSRENNTPKKAFSTVSREIDGFDVFLVVAPPEERLELRIGEAFPCFR